VYNSSDSNSARVIYSTCGLVGSSRERDFNGLLISFYVFFFLTMLLFWGSCFVFLC